MPDPHDPTGIRPAISSGPAVSSQAAPPPQPASPEIDATLARLEQNSREVQNVLDTIERKIARLEPHVERLHQTSATEAASDPLPPLSGTLPPNAFPPDTLTSDDLPADTLPSDPSSPPLPDANPRRRRSDQGPLSWAQTPRAPVPSPAARLAGTPRHTTPFWSWRVWLLLALSLVFLSAGIAWIVRAHRPTPSTQASLPTLDPQADAAPSDTTSSLAKPSAGSAPFSPRDTSDPTAANTAPTGDALTNNALSDEPTTAPADTTSTPDFAPAPASGAPALPSHSGTRPSLPTGVTAIAPGKVRVSSGVMAGNLLYSRAPEQPGGLARLFRVEGRVTMQVVISPTGHVGNIRILSGHHLLRGPARDAVSTWRYRPLLVNGIPVEVATIVSIDFRR